ncbi:hypothetical protein LHJ74_19215 [Streptomyces sp. N2-109]|uniref:Secreted protein n=1 Tax=Streptomyces gossypii TaxID=2883101 RepID=A0ABT2JVT8_9ACTN|nr:hypothetical protein [Streptomyces gossypii]MCT2592005.1 hypothetical protein [Streptomyces gossypii]
MSIRRTMKARRTVTAVAITTGLALAAVGCSGGGDDDKPESESSSGETQPDGDKNGDGGGGSDESGGDQVLAEVKGGQDITLTIKSATRDDGDFVTVSGTVKNGSGKLWLNFAWSGEESELRAKNEASMAGANLIDKSGRKRYFILRDTDGRCLCTVFKGGVQAGESTTWYTQFPAPPEGNNKVDFQIAEMPPASITISEG